MTTIINGKRFACIPGGRFLMGSPNGTPFSRSNESPVCEAEVGSFFMSIFPITQGEFSRIMLRNPSYFSEKGGATATLSVCLPKLNGNMPAGAEGACFSETATASHRQMPISTVFIR